MKTVLNIGCGNSELPHYLKGHLETRLDIDPGVFPDIVASALDLGNIGEFDIVYSCHVLEHLYEYQVETAVSEMHRVLRVGGVIIAHVPDLSDVQCTEEVLYVSEAGPITGRDMYYGLRTFLEINPYMAHKTGFVKETFKKALGIFNDVQVMEDRKYNMMGVGVK